MPQCPLCGNQSNNSPFTYNNSVIHYPCTFCKSKLINMMYPERPADRDNALRWAKNILDTKYNPPATDTLKKLYSISLKAGDALFEQKDNASSQQVNHNEENNFVSRQSIANIDKQYLPVSSYSGKVKIIVIIFACITVLSGVISGTLIGGFGGFLLGLIASGISAGIVYVISMMLVETSENTAIGARSALRTEKMIEELYKKDKDK